MTDFSSGVKAMETNGSPKLVFSPNNDTDVYTLAVAYTNEEFARIQQESSQGDIQTDNGKSGTQSVVPQNERSLKEVLKEAEYHRVEAIAEIIDRQGFITPSEAQSACGKSESTTWRYISMLINMGYVVSEGSTNNVVYKRKRIE